VSQDFAMGLTEFVAWVGAELVGQPATALVEESERLGGAAGVVQRAEKPRDERFADEVVQDERQELVHDKSGFAGAQFGVKQVLDGRQPRGLQRLAVNRGNLRGGVVAEYRAAPQRECGTDQLDGVLVRARGRRSAQEVAEAQDIECVDVCFQDVTPGAGPEVDSAPRSLRSPAVLIGSRRS
jgi:hypothetical protein